MKLNKKLKHKWLKALRSGKYEQGQGFLERDNKFCCLGVLCDIMKLQRIEKGISKTTFCYKETASTSALPGAFAEEIGMSHSMQEKLWTMNDTEGKSFKEIAKYISRNL